MPGCLTHYYCAKKTIEGLKKEGIPVNETAFLWGAQGPDIFFYHRQMPWNGKSSLKKLGTRFHHSKPSQHFECAAEYVKNHNISDVAHSYFLGNICHYSADRTCHPFIRAWDKIYRSRYPEKPSFPWHTVIETSLNIIILRYETGKLPTDISLKKCLPKDREVMREIGNYWKAVVKGCFDEDIPDNAEKYLAKDMRRMFGLMNNRLILKKPFIESVERIAKRSNNVSAHLMGISEGDIDYSNIAEEVWDEKNGRSEDFFVLYERAVSEGIKLIKECDKALNKDGSFAEITHDISY